jgi:preprotein translocase subunit SecD
MKTINLITILCLIALFSCSSNEKTIGQKVSFEIYETVRTNQLPASIAESMKTANIEFEKDLQLPTIGYILKTDRENFALDYPKEQIKFVKSIYTVDKEAKYLAVIAIKSNPTMTNQDIQNTKASGKNVEIHFNLSGARKWAEMTKKNVGNMVAFTIDNQVYAMPLVNAEIKIGLAVISGLDNEAMAEKISGSLNASIP